MSNNDSPRPPEPADRCVCQHLRAEHAMRDGVLACTVKDCACGPGCIHEGFVDWESVPAPTPEPVDPLKSFDAQVWAKEFVRLVKAGIIDPSDDGLMIGWFANALMRGYDEHAWRKPVSGEPEGEVPPSWKEHVPAIGEAIASLRGKSKEWWLARANAEEGYVVGAGASEPPSASEERLWKIANELAERWFRDRPTAQGDQARAMLAQQVFHALGEVRRG
jgi:hypothetical protein